MILLLLLTGAAVYGQTVEVLIKNAEAAIEKKDFDGALKILNGVLAKQPANDAALTQRARVYFFQNKLAESFAETEKILAANPKNADALNLRGILKRELKKDYNGALADFTAALAVNPNFFKALFNRADLLLAAERLEQAFADANKAVEIVPDNALAWLTRGKTYYYLKKYPEALPDLNKAISLDSGCGGCYAQRAQVKANIVPPSTPAASDANRAAWLEDILSDAEKSLALSPNNSLALFVRGFVNFSKKNYAAAWKDFYAVYRAVPLNKDNRQWMIEMSRFTQEAGSLPQILEIIGSAKAEFEKDFSNLNAARNLKWAFDLVGYKANPAPSETFDSYLKSAVSRNPNSACLNYLVNEGDTRSNYYAQRAVKNYDKTKEAKCAALAANQIAINYILKTNACEDCLMQADSLANLKTAMTWTDEALSISPNLPEALKTKENVLGWIKRREDLIAQRDRTKTWSSSSSTAANAPRAQNDPVLTAEFNSIASQIPQLQSQQKRLERKVESLMQQNAGVRRMMYNSFYNDCNGVIAQHGRFVEQMRALKEKAYGKADNLIPLIEQHIRDGSSAIDKLIQVRTAYLYSL